MSYNVFRWYRAAWGRTIQADPLLNLDFARSLQMLLEDAPRVSLDRVDWYGYAANTPLFFIDPIGPKVKNNTNCRIYVKDTTTSQVYPVYLGEVEEIGAPLWSAATPVAAVVCASRSWRSGNPQRRLAMALVAALHIGPRLRTADAHTYF